MLQAMSPSSILTKYCPVLLFVTLPVRHTSLLSLLHASECTVLLHLNGMNGIFYAAMQKAAVAVIPAAIRKNGRRIRRPLYAFVYSSQAKDHRRHDNLLFSFSTIVICRTSFRFLGYLFLKEPYHPGLILSTKKCRRETPLRHLEKPARVV